jgi:hypothetical protein
MTAAMYLRPSSQKRQRSLRFSNSAVCQKRRLPARNSPGLQIGKARGLRPPLQTDADEEAQTL